MTDNTDNEVLGKVVKLDETTIDVPLEKTKKVRTEKQIQQFETAKKIRAEKIEQRKLEKMQEVDDKLLNKMGIPEFNEAL